MGKRFQETFSQGTTLVAVCDRVAVSGASGLPPRTFHRSTTHPQDGSVQIFL